LSFCCCPFLKKLLLLLLCLSLQERDSTTSDLTKGEPMFCFETAVKLFFWSCLVYDYEEVCPHCVPVCQQSLYKAASPMVGLAQSNSVTVMGPSLNHMGGHYTHQMV
jgi:hypothetical protein